MHANLGGRDSWLRVYLRRHLSDEAKQQLRRRIETVRAALAPFARLAMGFGVNPYSDRWGWDRGLPVHRWYVERFLESSRAEIRGHCLEFQEDLYCSRFGGPSVMKLDILHLDASNPNATIVADLTKPNCIPSDLFDCIICIHVLHVIYELDRAIADLHRVLKPGGVLLVAVPCVSMFGLPVFEEFWRFTPDGLNRVLRQAFTNGTVEVQALGNSLMAAAEIRGMSAAEFTDAEKRRTDERFPVEICARAVKGRSWASSTPF